MKASKFAARANKVKKGVKFPQRVTDKVYKRQDNGKANKGMNEMTNRYSVTYIDDNGQGQHEGDFLQKAEAIKCALEFNGESEVSVWDNEMNQELFHYDITA